MVRYYVSRTTPANLNRVAEELAGDRELFQTFEASDYADQYFDLYQTLHAILPYARDRQKQEQEPYYGESQDLLTDAVFEELVFLSEMSGLVSRVKRIITHAIEAGFTVIETSQEVYEQGIQPHLKDSDQVKKDVCKELGNWMVTGLGGAAVGMIGGPLAGVVTAGMIKTGTNLAFLLVIDPP